MGGTVAEGKLVEVFKTNTTLVRNYATIHDPALNNLNTKMEVRNKNIARLIKQGKSWDHLDPDPEVHARWVAAETKRKEEEKKKKKKKKKKALEKKKKKKKKKKK